MRVRHEGGKAVFSEVRSSLFRSQESGVQELKELRQRFQGLWSAPDDGDFLTERREGRFFRSQELKELLKSKEVKK